MLVYLKGKKKNHFISTIIQFVDGKYSLLTVTNTIARC